MSLSKLNTDTKTTFQNICRDLNMDKETEEYAWNKYIEVSEKYTLDGSQSLWLCCALYTATRESYRPTVGGSNEIVKGNCVSPIKLLRSCNVSFYDFFTKVKHWCEMANFSEELIKQISCKERGFSISLHIFQYYTKIFETIFNVSSHEKKTKKSRPVKCAANKLYVLSWCLFLCAKNEIVNRPLDIVTSFHLLVCCIDLIYVNALSENRVDLINVNFEGVPPKWNTAEYDLKESHKHSIIEPLCKLAKGVYEEAMFMKRVTFKNIINQFIKTKTLLGREETFMEVISNNNFEPNLKSLNTAYEQYILCVGDIDERSFLPSPEDKKCGSNEPFGSNGVYFHKSEFTPGSSTPLTRRDVLPAKDNNTEPIASATQSVRRLTEIAKLIEPLEFIKQAAGESTFQSIVTRVEYMKDQFVEKFPKKEEAVSRFNVAKGLFFYILKKILQSEKQTKPNVDLKVNAEMKVVLETESLTTTLMACCVEIVIDAWYGSNFPWVLTCFDIHPFNFTKIIEVVVKALQVEPIRNTIKSLNRIEEVCLEFLSWTKNSLIWDCHEKLMKKFPSWANVDVNKMAQYRENNVPQSPKNITYDCFNSTGSASTSETARRALFNAEKASGDVSKLTPVDCKKNPSLIIFLRKFYQLGWVRLKELCRELELSEQKHIKIIWTVFEYSITNTTELMKDRHLDQLLMCAIYIYIRVKEISGKTFTDIMKMYRKQPLSVSSTYREVLIDPTNPDESKRYGDIISFYNKIYVVQMSPFALNFSEKKKSHHELLLSPHPTEKINPPTKVSNQITIEKLSKKHAEELRSSPNCKVFEIYKSPSKDLDRLNKLVRGGKRNLSFSDEDSVEIKKGKAGNPHLQGKILNIKKDRQERKQ